MSPHVRPASARTVRPWALLACAALAAGTLAACGSSHSSASASASALQGTARQQACTAVSTVLADGPDADADSVGYAEAQVLPLRQLKLGDPVVGQAVSQLDSAYQAFSTAGTAAAPAAAIAVTKAQNAVNALCPGAAS
ncbi:hypothetical protein [Streptacidiphilus sp. P02-A3a]|uniref:hypothetical protein n=1 Tax=Streptacidiphilus sp. P02-A3a TaxID=2704468 RepID=UPI0015F8B93C|nr:hypothetical protein [Streptacidiphilus sp. P02-A3a]QMU71077.1 hypothetical protein GXP74_25490 [Streptacidiphilus sp. P02-A3a]